MRDSQVSMSQVVATALWVGVATLIAGAWTLLAFGHRDVAVMLGLTACATSGAAATAHVRCFALRLSALFKDANTIRRNGGSGSVSSMR